jgi:hydrogenase expression/formation protein HypE
MLAHSDKGISGGNVTDFEVPERKGGCIMSKFSLETLNRCVYPFTGGDAADIILGASFGEDVALTRIGDDLLASHVDPIVGAIGNIGWLAVHVACNDIAASGILPRWVLMLVLVPRKEDEQLLRQIMGDASQAAGEIGVSIIGGHAGYSAGITRPVVAVTALGAAAGRRPVLTGGARPGDRVLVTRGIALEGTAILAEDFADVARQKGLTAADLAEAAGLVKQVSVVREALAMADQGVTAMHDVTRGGLLETLLEIAHASNVAIELEFERLPVPPVVSRFAEAFDFNPLQMISSGTLAATVPPERVADVQQALSTKAQVPFAFAGRVVEGSGVTVIRDGRELCHPQVRCEDDELARLWALYPRD